MAGLLVGTGSLSEHGPSYSLVPAVGQAIGTEARSLRGHYATECWPTPGSVLCRLGAVSTRHRPFGSRS